MNDEELLGVFGEKPLDDAPKEDLAIEVSCAPVAESQVAVLGFDGVEPSVVVSFPLDQ